MTIITIEEIWFGVDFTIPTRITRQDLLTAYHMRYFVDCNYSRVVESCHQNITYRIARPSWLFGNVGDTFSYFTDMSHLNLDGQRRLERLYINPHVAVIDHSKTHPLQFFKKFVFNPTINRLFAVYTSYIEYMDIYDLFDNNHVPADFATTKLIYDCPQGGCAWKYQTRPFRLQTGLSMSQLAMLFDHDWGKIHTANVLMRYGAPLASFVRVCELFDNITSTRLSHKIFLSKVGGVEIYTVPVDIVGFPEHSTEERLLTLSVHNGCYAYNLFTRDEDDLFRGNIETRYNQNTNQEDL